MRILVTGGTGFIGRSLCRRLITEGYDVAVASRQPAALAGLFGNEITSQTYPISSHDLDRIDAIINLAGAPIFGPRWTPSRKKVLRESRVGVTDQLVRAIEQANHKPTVLISGSAIGFYGDRQEHPIDESIVAGHGFAAELCDDWERAAYQATAFGVRVCTLRTGLVLGSGGGLLARMAFPFRLGLGGRLGSGGQWMSWIHIDDHVNALLFLLNSAKSHGAFNLTAPNPVSNREFTSALAKVLRRPAVFSLPDWLLRSTLGEMAGLLLDSQRVLPLKLQHSTGFDFTFPDLMPALTHCLTRR